MEKITFVSAKYSSTLINGLSVDFWIRYLKKKDGFLKDEEFDSCFKVTLTKFALIEWGMIENIDQDKLVKLTFPFAEQWIIQRVKDGTLKDFEEKVISTEDKINPYPFDIGKIDKIEGYEIILPENHVDIGTRIQTNLIADRIIELRDNINALIYSKHNDSLFKLGQERNVLSLFRHIDNKEQFSYAVSTLGNLVNDLNSSLLKKITGNKENGIKSFALLDNFLKIIDSEEEIVVDVFKTINRIRQGFPIHTDKSGIIKNLRKFNIEYPITNYHEVWLMLLDKYTSALTILLEKVKVYAT